MYKLCIFDNNFSSFGQLTIFIRYGQQEVSNFLNVY